ncbi:UDP-2,4-diacetamido-2,4,6-trideoxy-beta-L-altropyranose hydrolase [Sporosarcina koreensis]|uniref:UDP-2,4-diacetamido-2,4, 6-trideoxy-beta-L-altropyranose hydrolase n=1 Tax=Sporosarcina koreensis TaxID=334735 RepID=UPI001365DA07|nr:UDP-2,4-diacetamido-2,4,6-trideoxy-beta-L-altropyranose hydrolase [Sporosarcina koreensis]
MNVVIRTDASNEIGTGHVMRCLTLAKQLKRHGAKVTFVCRSFEGHLHSYLRDQDMSVKLIPYTTGANEADLQWTKENWMLDAEQTITIIEESSQKVDLLIVDHYGLDRYWENKLRHYTKYIMVIDDLADRKHDCDIILDNTFGITEEKYSGLLTSQTIGLYGVKYCLLREQFKKNQKSSFRYDYRCIKVHMFFGGIDFKNYTTKYSKFILKNFQNVKIMAVVGSTFGYQDDLNELKKKYKERFQWEMAVKDMAAHMNKCDIALGAPGTATWERACIGLPSAYFSVNKNQVPILEELEKNNFCMFLGEASNTSEKTFILEFNKFISSAELLNTLFIKNTKCIDGKGTERIVEVLSRLIQR